MEKKSKKSYGTAAAIEPASNQPNNNDRSIEEDESLMRVP